MNDKSQIDYSEYTITFTGKASDHSLTGNEFLADVYGLGEFDEYNFASVDRPIKGTKLA